MNRPPTKPEAPVTRMRVGLMAPPPPDSVEVSGRRSLPPPDLPPDPSPIAPPPPGRGAPPPARRPRTASLPPLPVEGGAMGEGGRGGEVGRGNAPPSSDFASR